MLFAVIFILSLVVAAIAGAIVAAYQIVKFIVKKYKSR